MTILGKNIDRVDAFSKVTGQALYPGDFSFPNQLYMKVLFANKVHAVIRSIDISRAKSVPGVIMILTATDVPNNEYGLGVPDQPVLCGPGSNKQYADHVRFIGDQVALVIAESEDAAEYARRLIKVDYEDLPVISDPFLAMQEGALLIHPERESNIFTKYRVRKGDTQKAFSEAEVVIEGKYSTPVQEHAYLQPEAGVSYIDDEGRVTVVVGGQWIHEDQEQIAHSLNLENEQVRVIYPAIGGAFGGREDMSVQIILGLAALKLKEKGILRPVKIVWSREESIIGHHKRHAFFFKTKWAATKDGILTAAQVDIISDGGAYIYTSPKVLGNAVLMSTGPYNIPNVAVDARAVYTNNIPAGAFRGFGGPQGAFVAESQMNKLAERLKIDPVELRRKNLLKEGEPTSVGTPLPEGITIDQVVESCASHAGWLSDKKLQKPILPQENSIKRGIGFACSFKNIGFSFGAPENCWAIVELYGDSSIKRVVLHHAGAEVGQGSHTVFKQMTAEAVGVPVEMVELRLSDTAIAKNSGSVSASRMTFMAGNAIRGAAKQALEKWNNKERPAIAEFQYWPPKTTPMDPETGYCMPNFAYGYTAQAVECEVDIDTGKVKITRVVCADDVGKAVNPQLIEGQIEGAIVQATGYAITENFIQKNGIALTDKLSTYLIPTVLDIPDKVESIILECADKNGPWGIKGMGEMPYLPYAPAVTAAVHDAIGIWFDDFPLTSEKVYLALKNRRQ